MAKDAAVQQAKIEQDWEFLPLDEVFCSVPEASMVVANSADERKEAVFERVVTLWEEGADPADVVIVASCPESAAYLQTYLTQRTEAEVGEADPASEDPFSELADFVAAVSITWARDVACSVLATPAAQTVTGRRWAGEGPRILSAFEVDFLMEDLKTWGSRPGRLRELCKFLYRGMTELADEASHWLIMVEEIEIYRFMRRELEYLGAVLEPEIANLTTKALRGDAELRTRYAKSHVIAYDYQYLSRASQLLCHLLAAESLWAIAGVNTTVEVFESYPFSRGVEEFTRIHEDAEVTWVGVSGAQIKSHVEWKDPAAEFEGVAQDIAQTVATGVSGQLAGPEDIVGKVEAAKTAEVVDVADGGAGLEQVGVVCFHPYWAAKIQRALEQCNVPVNSWYNPLTLRGDVRENVLCAPLRVVTLLHLLVNDQDSVAWRAWFGFGDYLGRSADFKAIREQAQAQNPQAKFATFACTTDWGIQVLDTLKDFKPLRGQELLSALWAFVCTDVDGLQEVAHASQALPAMLRPLLTLGDAATAADMIAHLDALQFASGLCPTQGVVVTSLAGAAALEFDKLYVVGFVNGLFPVRDFFDLTKITVDKQNKMAAENEETVELLNMLAREEIVVSTFAEIDVELARRASVKQDRIFQDEDGCHKSDVSESICLELLMK